METISDSFSEFGANYAIQSRNGLPKQASFATSDGTTLGSYIESEGLSESFISNSGTSLSKAKSQFIEQSDLSRDNLQCQRLQSELSHYKQILSEFTSKHAEYQTDINSQNEELFKLKSTLREKDSVIASLKKELEHRQEIDQSKEQIFCTEKHKLKMKIDYLTKKCFQLSCQLDRKDPETAPKPENEDYGMLMDIVEKKQKEYCDTEKNQLQDPTDFLFDVFAQYENMQKTIRKLSEQNNELKQNLIETKVKWAESEGAKEKIEIELDSLICKSQRASLTSGQTSLLGECSLTDSKVIFKNEQTLKRDSSKKSLASRYLPSFGFWKN